MKIISTNDGMNDPHGIRTVRCIERFQLINGLRRPVFGGSSSVLSGITSYDFSHIHPSHLFFVC